MVNVIANIKQQLGDEIDRDLTQTKAEMEMLIENTSFSQEVQFWMEKYDHVLLYILSMTMT